MSDPQFSATSLNRLIVAGTAFAYASLAFVAAVLVLIPATGSTLPAWGAPSSLITLLTLAELIGLPIVAAIAGIEVGSRLTAPADEPRVETA